MNMLYTFLIASANLPSLDGITNWGQQIIEQVVMLTVFFLVGKYLINLKIGKIVMITILGGVIYFIIRNWSTVSNWINAFIDTL